ncbi:MAG: nucleotidyltransferase family protein [Cytophagaceae bacterium]|nr:nucleotidyltransferase family protein [Cytophagaceae bacterium]
MPPKEKMTTTEQNQFILSYLRPFQPERVGIFGSFARGENQAKSDLDILIKLSQPVSLLTLVRMQRELSELLNIPVDLVTEGALKNERFRKAVFQDLKVIQE